MANPIEPADFDDGDSGYGTSEYSTASITSSIYAYEQRYGRSYHAYNAGKYYLPNDEGEQERMDIHYHALRLLLENRLFLAPLENPAAILDVGTGTGIWAMDVADEYPGAEVTGFDLSPIQPGYVPPNCSFQVFDLENEWDMPNRFDLVHTRYMNGFSIKSWPRFFEEAYKALKPGGWVENQEFDFFFQADDNSVPADCTLRRFQDLWNDGVATVGQTGRCYGDKIAEDMKAAGFINVTLIPLKLPIGTWPKDRRLREAGLFCYLGMTEGLRGLTVKVFLHLMGWSSAQFEAFLVEIREDFKNCNRQYHTYFPLYIIYGQKPF